MPSFCTLCWVDPSVSPLLRAGLVSSGRHCSLQIYNLQTHWYRHVSATKVPLQSLHMLRSVQVYLWWLVVILYLLPWAHLCWPSPLRCLLFWGVLVITTREVESLIKAESDLHGIVFLSKSPLSLHRDFGEMGI